MISKFKYSYISFEKNHSIWDENPTADISLSYNSYNIDYNFNLNKQLNINKGFIKSIIDNNKKQLVSNIVPPAIKYHSNGVVVFERPPSYQVIQYAPQNVGNLNDETPIYVYRIPVPWQLYIISYDPNKYFCNSVQMYFMKSSLNSSEQNIYMPPIPNFFTNGLLCRPMFENMNDIDGYSKDLSGVIASAYDWIWNTGFNHDLTENFYHVIRQKKPVKLMTSYLNLGQNVNTHGYYRGMTPTHIQGVLRDWESLDLDNILDLDWPNPSLTQTFESDRGYYYEHDPERFDLDTSCDDPSESIDVSDLYNEPQTYRQMIHAFLEGEQSPMVSSPSIDKSFLESINFLKSSDLI
jgi:hypothetical protein